MNTAVTATTTSATNTITAAPRNVRDSGSVLILTLVLGVLLSVVVLGAAAFVTTGLRGTTSTQGRVDSTLGANAALTYWVEELAAGRAAACASATKWSTPSAATGAGGDLTVTVTCAPAADVGGTTAIELTIVATSQAGSRDSESRVTAIVQLPAETRATRVVSAAAA